MSVIDGIVSGLDTTTIINQLMSLEQGPLNRLQAQSTKNDSRVKAWQDVDSGLSNVRTTSQALARTATFTSVKATSSSTDLATATARLDATPGTYAFRVKQLATAHQLMTSASVGSAATTTGSGQIAVGAGLASLGVATLTTDGTAAAGANTVTVADAPNGQITVTIGTSSVTVAANAATATVGGVTLTAATGGFVTGSGRLQVVTTDASTTLGSLVASFATSDSIASAQLLALGSTQTPDQRLVFTSKQTGTANSLLIGSNGLDPSLAASLTGLTELSAAKDAQIQIGTGATVISRSSNKISDVFNGIDVQLVRADPTTDVVVTAQADVDSQVKAVSDWVNAINGVLTSIDSKSTYDPSTNTAGLFLGDMTAFSVRSSINTMMAQAQGSGIYSTLSDVGVSIDANGHYTFDETKLRTALAADPNTVANIFASGGSGTNSAVKFVSSSDATVPGSYTVAITQASAPASVSGTAFTALGQDETVNVQLGATTATIVLHAGQTPQQVAATLNNAFAANGLDVTADVSTGVVRIQSVAHGSAVTLAVRSSLAVGGNSTGLGGATANTYASYSGVDVAGTINGVAATGSGKILSGASGNAASLRLEINATAPGDLGTFTYSAGRAGALLNSLGSTGDIENMVTNALSSLNTEKDSFVSRIADEQDRLQRTHDRYRTQFANLETVLGQLKAQGSRLSAALGSLPAAG